VTPSGNAAAAFVQDSIHIRPCDPQGRHASYNDSSQQSDGKGIEEYPPIERE
jgi:Cu2+-containing amine oxidase